MSLIPNENIFLDTLDNESSTIENTRQNNSNSRTLITRYFQNEKNTYMCQVIFSFVWGILLSPWSKGLIYLFASIILYEILYYVFSKGDPRYYNVFYRTGVICSSVLGFIIGRTLAGEDVCAPGI